MAWDAGKRIEKYITKVLTDSYLACLEILSSFVGEIAIPCKLECLKTYMLKGTAIWKEIHLKFRRSTCIKPCRLSRGGTVVPHGYRMPKGCDPTHELLEPWVKLHKGSFWLFENPEATHCLTYEKYDECPACQYVSHWHAFVRLFS